jgi:DNA-binding CsgD family transcriptional regulator
MHFPGSRAVAQGQQPLPFPVCRILAFSPSQTKCSREIRDKAARQWVLSKRELQVLLLMCDGLTGKEIAQRLGISPKNVEFHRAGIYKRLGLKTTAHLVRYAIRMGLIEP